MCNCKVKENFEINPHILIIGGRMRLSDLQTKNIVSMDNGKNIGNIIDVKINEKGMIDALVIEQNRNMLSFLNREGEMYIDWKDIEKIGEDVILVRTHY